jgi:hypothetical protein
MAAIVRDVGAVLRDLVLPLWLLSRLPCRNPDRKPIGQVFAKLRSPPRKMAFRTADALWNALGSITGCVSLEEYRNFIRHAGYCHSG